MQGRFFYKVKLLRSSYIMKGLHMVAFLVLVVGGLNWLVFGLSGWDIGQLFGGMDQIVSRVIYVLVGLAAVYEIATHKKICKMCVSKSSVSNPTSAV